MTQKTCLVLMNAQKNGTLKVYKELNLGYHNRNFPFYKGMQIKCSVDLSLKGILFLSKLQPISKVLGQPLFYVITNKEQLFNSKDWEHIVLPLSICLSVRLSVCTNLT